MRSGLFILFLLFLLAACERQPVRSLSRVNGRSISQDDFVFAYETSPRSSLTGSKKEAYNRVLEGIIQRILLAKEAERRGLQQQTETAGELEYLEDAAIRRELFRRHIRKKVQVSDEDCRRAFDRDQRTLWVQHAIVDSNEELNPGVWNPAWSHVGISPATKTVETDNFGKVDLVNWNDVDLKLEGVLYGLGLNEVSGPVFRKGAIHVFRLVNTETNGMTSENQYQLEREHYRSVVRKRREHALAFNFVQKVMAPEGLSIRRRTLEQLTQVLWRQLPRADSLAGETARELNRPVRDVDDLNDLELAAFKSGRLLVKDFRFFYKMNPRKLVQTSPAGLRNGLINAIGIYVRDIVFARQGRTEGLADVPAVRKDFQYWRERLLAAKLDESIYQRVLTTQTSIPETAGRIAADELDELSKNLKQNATISINEEMLMTSKTGDEGLPRKIDFFATYLN